LHSALKYIYKRRIKEQKSDVGHTHKYIIVANNIYLFHKTLLYKKKRWLEKKKWNIFLLLIPAGYIYIILIKYYVFSWPIKICKSDGVVVNALDDCDRLEGRLCKTTNLF